MSAETSQPATERRRATSHQAYFKWGAILLTVVLIFVFFAFYARQFGAASLKVDLKGKTLSVETEQLRVSSEQASGFDPKQNYIDSAKGFSFKLPTTQGWSKPSHFSGIKAFFEGKGLTLGPEYQEHLIQAMSDNPVGPMFSNVEGLRITSGESIVVEITDETSNELLNSFIESDKKRAQLAGTPYSEDDLSKMRREFLRSEMLGIKDFKFSNEFIISVYDKTKLGGVPFKLSLPNFFIILSSSVGLNFEALEAKEQSILGGMSVSFQRVKINGMEKDLTVNRWFLITESDKMFYVAEIAYSPETKGSMQVWEDLTKMMKSFRVIETNK